MKPVERPLGQLDQRKQAILRALVDEFIETAEPVASKTLVEKHHLLLSSASVRHSLAELEKLGYLEQPHTSAGRIPTDLGYKTYVKSLMPRDELDEETKTSIRRRLETSLHELPDLLKQASALLAESSGYASVVLTPGLSQSKLLQIKLLMIEKGRALVVVVLSDGVVKDRLLRIPELLDEGQLATIAEALEQGLGGISLQDITLVTVASVLERVQLPESLLNQILYETYLSIKQAEHLETYVDGMHRLISEPEFQTGTKAGALMSALSRDGLLVGLLAQPQAEDRVQVEEASTLPQQAEPLMVRIGQELALEELKDCSFVTSTYRLGEHLVGQIGVVGPKRMRYAQVVSQIHYIQSSMTQLLKHRKRELGSEIETTARGHDH